MTRVRKTRDEWQLWMNYGQGWEHEISEDTYSALAAQCRAYRENCPQYARKVVFKRVPIEASQAQERLTAENERLRALNAELQLWLYGPDGRRCHIAAVLDVLDLARNVAACDLESLLRSADLTLLRSVITEWVTEARAAIAKAEQS